MDKSTKRVQKVTSKGQITLPVSWRKKFNVQQVLVEPKGDFIEISSFSLDDRGCNEEYTVFDAIRDNNGKGLKAKDLLNILKKVDK